MEKYKYLFPYTMNCTGRNLVHFYKLVESERFKKIFKGDFSREKVIDYFMTTHNEETLNQTSMQRMPDNLKFLHLAIPYEFNETGDEILGVHKPFYKIPKALESRTINNPDIKLIKDLGILHPEHNVLISHGIYIAGSCRKEELEKYNYLYLKKEQAA